MKQAVLVIYRSANGRDGWQPVMQHDVPEWVKEPSIMGRLVAGEQCMDVAEGDAGSYWYRAVPVVSKPEQTMVNTAVEQVRGNATRH